MRSLDARCNNVCFPSFPSAAYLRVAFYIPILVILGGSFGWLLGETSGRVIQVNENVGCSGFSFSTDSCRGVLVSAAVNRAGLPTFQSGGDVRTPTQSPIPAQGRQQRGSPPISSFGGQLLQNFKGLFSKHNLKPLLIGSAATGLSSIADDEIQEYFGETRRFEALGEVGEVVGSSLVLGGFSGAMLLWGYNTESDQFRSFGFSLAQGFIVNAAVTAGIKAVIPRTRPDGENNHSFPSGHTSGSFTTAVIVAHYYGKFAIPAYVTAALVGLSRIEKNKHYLSDVVAGATLGFIVGRTVCRQTDTFRIGPITWMPLVLPEGGVAVAVSLDRQE